MVRSPGVKAVAREGIGALKQAKAGFFHDQMEKTGPAADRAVAVLDRELGRASDLEANAAAVAAAAMDDF
jgi:hypothetical protein